jgi:hypothetical protein
MRLLERIGVRDAPRAALISLHEYVSDRSVALSLRSSPAQLVIGSGVCILLGGRRLIATASHNIEDCQLADITVIARGERFGEALPLLRMGCSRDRIRDVGWLELDPEVRLPPRLRFITPDQIGNLAEEIDHQPCLLQGYPAARVEMPANPDQRPYIESDGLFTLSLSPARRRAPRTAGIDIAVEYPPHDGSIDDQGLPEPPGVSGGGIWLVPRFEDNPIWSAEKAKLVAISRGWWRDEREELATRIECWISLARDQIAEVRGEADAVLLNMRL